MTLSTTAVMHRLFAIEDDLRQLQEPYSEAAAEFAICDRVYKANLAEEFLEAEGSVKEREARALERTVDSPNYRELVVAERDLHRLKALVQLLETRATIGESLLKKMSVDPAWVMG